MTQIVNSCLLCEKRLVLYGQKHSGQELNHSEVNTSDILAHYSLRFEIKLDEGYGLTNNMFYGRRKTETSQKSQNQARFSQLRRSYKLYNILECVFPYMRSVFTFETSGCLVDVR